MFAPKRYASFVKIPPMYFRPIEVIRTPAGSDAQTRDNRENKENMALMVVKKCLIPPT